MRRIVGALGLVLLAPASVGWAQESLCNPCVDPPVYPQSLSPARSWRETLESLGIVGPESLEAVAPPRAEVKFNLGLSVANLRGFNTAGSSRTLTLVDSQDVEDEGAGESAAAAPVDAPEPAEPADPAPTETDNE